MIGLDEMPMTVRQPVITAGRPSAARLAVCTLAAVRVATAVITVIFLFFVIDDGGFTRESAVAAVGLLLFYAPATLWIGKGWSIAALLAAGLGAAVLTHRYAVTRTRRALQRTGRAVFALLLLYGSWVLVVGVALVAYSVSSGSVWPA